MKQDGRGGHEDVPEEGGVHTCPLTHHAGARTADSVNPPTKSVNRPLWGKSHWSRTPRPVKNDNSCPTHQFPQPRGCRHARCHDDGDARACYVIYYPGSDRVEFRRISYDIKKSAGTIQEGRAFRIRCCPHCQRQLTAPTFAFDILYNLS